MELNFVGGTTTAIVGSNGSGKSTLVKILAGLMLPSKGEVQLLVHGTMVESELRPLSCGLVAPYLNVYDGLTPRENLEFLAKARRLPNSKDLIDAVLDRVQLSDRGDDVVQTFSSGMIQRVRLATALLSDPPVVILDEPTATLDAMGEEMVYEVIERSASMGKIVIVATNDQAEAEKCQFQVNVESYR
ncbi:MAG: ABC transporter ATP-binding protein [Bacteroidetes bacterium]|nr:ABC transporter ATP-binding protein [Bacteroidota bacterium]